MRVLLSGYTCDPHGGSESANTWYTALELARLGTHVHLLTRAEDRDRMKAPVRQAVASGLPLDVSFLSSRLAAPMLNRGQAGVYAKYGQFQRRVAQWTREHSGWDVAHHVSWGSINHPVGLAGNAHPLVVGPSGGGQLLLPELRVWADGDVPYDRIRNMLGHRLIGLNPFTRRIVRAADVVLAANEDSAAVLRRLGCARVVMMIPDGLRSAPAPVATAGQRGATIVWIGRFLPIKAAGLALAAFRHVASTCDAANLVFVGQGPTAEFVRGQAADLIRERRVIMTGGVPWQEAQEILATADVHLFTSLRDSFGAQVLEAAAWGVPTVGLKLGGIASLRGLAGLELVDPQPAGDLPSRLGAALNRVLSEGKEERDRRRAAALRFAATATYESRARQLLSLYAGLVAEG